MDATLTEAAREGNAKLIKKLIQDGSDIHKVSSNGFPPLHYAMIVMPHDTKKDVLGTVKLLVEAGAKDDIDKPFAAGETPFMTACVEGQFESAKYLYETGSPDVKRKFENGNGILDDVILKLKNRPVDFTLTQTINGKKVTTKDKAKIRKALGSHPDDETDAYLNIVKFLLDKKIDFDSKNPNGQSALFTAVGAGVDEVVAMLIDAGAKVSVKDKSGLTPLHYACREGYGIVIDMLISAGADVNIQDDWGFTASHEAAMSGHVDIIRKLREADADFNIGLLKAFDKDYVKGMSALGVAQLKKNEAMLKLMKPAQLELEKDKYKGKKFDVPPKGWEWGRTKYRWHGVDVQKQTKDLLWYTETESHQGGGASHQSFVDFLVNGSGFPEMPEEIEKELREHILKHMK